MLKEDPALPLAVRHAVSNCEKEMAEKLNEDGGALMQASFFLTAILETIPKIELTTMYAVTSTISTSGTKDFEESSRWQGRSG